MDRLPFCFQADAITTALFEHFRFFQCDFLKNWCNNTISLLFHFLHRRRNLIIFPFPFRKHFNGLDQGIIILDRQVYRFTQNFIKQTFLKLKSHIRRPFSRQDMICINSFQKIHSFQTFHRFFHISQFIDTFHNRLQSPCQTFLHPMPLLQSFHPRRKEKSQFFQGKLIQHLFQNFSDVFCFQLSPIGCHNWHSIFLLQFLLQSLRRFTVRHSRIQQNDKRFPHFLQF